MVTRVLDSTSDVMASQNDGYWGSVAAGMLSWSAIGRGGCVDVREAWALLEGLAVPVTRYECPGPEKVAQGGSTHRIESGA
jgi:hypothetical protein